MEKDVLYYYEKMQKNIKIVEEDESNEEALNAVRYNFVNVYEYIKMFLIAKKERYYGYFLMDFCLKIDFTANFAAGVSIRKLPFEMAINPLLLGVYSLKEIIFIICHEIEHIVLDHPAQGQMINGDKSPLIHELLNGAMDASINDRLSWDIETCGINMMSTPADAVSSNELSKEYEYKFEKMKDFLYYYLRMKKVLTDEHTDFNSTIKGCVLMMGDGNKIITAKNRPKEIVLHSWTDMDNAEDIHEVLKNYIKQIVDGIPDENRGLLPLHQRTALEKMLAPAKINWKNVLKRYIAMTPYRYRKTITRLNRRQPDRFDLSGQVVNREVSLIVAIDTSGSVGKKELEDIFSEIFAILRIMKFNLTIIECDADIQNVYTARKMEDINFDVKGRGGTAFKPVIEYINQRKEFRNSVLVYFTDGMGEYSIPKPLVNRCLWVLTDGGKLSLKEAYGDIISIE